MGVVRAFSIKNQWMNLSLYFINFMYKTKNNPINNRVCEWITKKDRLKDNNNPIGGGQKNNKWLANGDNIKTDFIEINKEDFIYLFENKFLGFRINKNNLKGSYKRTDNITYANVTNQENNNNDPSLIYFLKGTNTNDILKYLVSAKII
jgi:hypothetical protein